MQRTYTILATSLTVSPIVSYIEKYIFSDWDFFNFLMVLVIIDTILGVWKHMVNETLSSKGFGVFFNKVATYLVMLVLCHVMANFTIEGKPSLVFSWMPHVIYSAIVVKEAISFIENIGAINPKWVPTSVLKRLKEFDKNGIYGKETSRETDKKNS